MSEFRAGLADIFEEDVAELTPATRLDDLAWDSLAMVSTIALIDETSGKEVRIDDLKACETIGDLEALAAQ